MKPWDSQLHANSKYFFQPCKPTKTLNAVVRTDLPLSWKREGFVFNLRRYGMPVKTNESNTPPYVVATRYAMLPDKEEALNWLETAREKNDGMENLLFDDCWDKYRREQWFKEIVKKVGLDPWQ